MKALVIRSLDGPRSLVVDEIEEPSPDPDGILIEVVAAGMTFPDVLLSRGLYQYKPDLPFVPGCEIAGRVICAPENSEFHAGQPVAAYCFVGGFAERVAVPADRVFPMPAQLDFVTAAAMPMNYLTMHFGLVTRGRVQPGDWVVVHGAGGGLGVASIQIAKAWGARVIAIASSEAKRAEAVRTGADHAIPVEGFLDSVRALTAGQGADIVVDPVGGDRVTDSLRCLAPLGQLLVLGFTSGEIASVKTNRLLLNNLDVVGVGWGAYVLERPGFMRQQWDDLIQRMDSHHVSIGRPTVVDLADIPDQLIAMENRSVAGKVVARLSQD